MCCLVEQMRSCIYSSKGELTECLSNFIYDEINIEYKLTEYIASHITGEILFK